MSYCKLNSIIDSNIMQAIIYRGCTGFFYINQTNTNDRLLLIFIVKRGLQQLLLLDDKLLTLLLMPLQVDVIVGC